MRYNYEILIVPFEQVRAGERPLDELGSEGFRVIDVKIEIRQDIKYLIYHLEKQMEGSL